MIKFDINHPLFDEYCISPLPLKNLYELRRELRKSKLKDQETYFLCELDLNVPALHVSLFSTNSRTPEEERKPIFRYSSTNIDLLQRFEGQEGWAYIIDNACNDHLDILKRNNNPRTVLESKIPPSMTSSESSKTLNVTSSKDLKEKVSDVEIYGNPDTFTLICKASSKEQGWMKSTKAMQVGNTVVLQVTTQQRNPDGSYAIAEALTNLHNVTIDQNEKVEKIIRPLTTEEIIKRDLNENSLREEIYNAEIKAQMVKDMKFSYPDRPEKGFVDYPLYSKGSSGGITKEESSAIDDNVVENNVSENKEQEEKQTLEGLPSASVQTFYADITK